MDSNDNNAKNSDSVTTAHKIKRPWKPFLRQLLISSAVWTSYFVYGLCIGAPTVFIPQIRKENNSSTTVIDIEMASWLNSAISFSSLPCVFVLCILSKLIGRKICFFIACADTFISFIVFYCSSSVLQILISEIMQGLFSSAQIIICPMLLTEYTSPKYRGFFLTIKSASFYWGVWVSNATGTFFHWKKIGLTGIVCALYMMITVLMWPKSPYWLASKGRYAECAVSHRWLKGCDEESEKELINLINTQKEYTLNCEHRKLSKKETVKDLYKTIVSKEFYKPTLIAILTGKLCTFSGKLVCTIYIIDIIKTISENESTAYTGMLILDGITVFSMYMGCILSKFIKRRTLLLVSSFIAAAFMFLISLYLYLIHIFIIKENQYVSIGLLMLYSIALSCGPLILATSACVELIPIRSRNLSVCVIAVTGKLFQAITLKVSPSIFECFGLHGAFLYFGIASSITIALLYRYLPETKDKTLQEIADSINGIKKVY